MVTVVYKNGSIELCGVRAVQKHRLFYCTWHNIPEDFTLQINLNLKYSLNIIRSTFQGAGEGAGLVVHLAGVKI
jgi:hypothetical protein